MYDSRRPTVVGFRAKGLGLGVWTMYDWRRAAVVSIGEVTPTSSTGLSKGREVRAMPSPSALAPLLRPAAPGSNWVGGWAVVCVCVVVCACV